MLAVRTGGARTAWDPGGEGATDREGGGCAPREGDGRALYEHTGATLEGDTFIEKINEAALTPSCCLRFGCNARLGNLLGGFALCGLVRGGNCMAVSSRRNFEPGFHRSFHVHSIFRVARIC